MKYYMYSLLPISITTVLSSQDQWLVSFSGSNDLKTYTSRDVTAIGSFGGGALNSIKLQDKVNADHVYNMQGIKIGKNFDFWRLYAEYDIFTYEKDKNEPFDKNVDGWILTLNSDYLFKLPSVDNFAFFIGGAVAVAGAKPEGLKSSSAPAIGGQTGFIFDFYKRPDYTLSLEAGFRYMVMSIEFKENITDPYLVGATESQLKYVDPSATLTSIKLEADTTTLKNTYLSLNILF